MRYSVFDSRGNWQASYSHKFPNTSLKVIKSWAIQTAKLVGGKVYERIVPSDKRYKPKDHLMYDFTNLRSKLRDDQPNAFNKSSNKKDKKNKDKNKE
tara:strand:+ start:2450 stop:2740 length:291 start_codon:yes stop_codon:yes gene_type:complete